MRLLAGFFAGALLAVCFPPYNLPFLMPIAIGALLASLRNLSPRMGLYTGLVFGISYFGGTMFWLTNVYGASGYGLIFIAALFPMFFGFLFVWITIKLPKLPEWFTAPVIWTAIEFFRSELFILKFGYMGLGYGVVNYAWLVEPASWFGSYFVTYLIVLLGVFCFKPAMALNKQPFRYPLLIIIWIGLFFVPSKMSRVEQPVNVRLIQAGTNDYNSLYGLSKKETSAPLSFIVWPEYSIYSDITKDEKTKQQLAELTKTMNAFLVFGSIENLMVQDQLISSNTAFVMSPEGEIIGKAPKYHHVHFFNEGIPAKTIKAITTSKGRIGVAVCFDFDFPDVARKLVQDGAEVFLIPNLDMPQWGLVQQSIHRASFQMRAVECGRWLARADIAGGTSAAAPNGREYARVYTSSHALLDVQVGMRHNKTIYIRGGWLFGWIIFLAGAGLLTVAFVAPLKKQE